MNSIHGAEGAALRRLVASRGNKTRRALEHCLARLTIEHGRARDRVYYRLLRAGLCDNAESAHGQLASVHRELEAELARALAWQMEAT